MKREPLLIWEVRRPITDGRFSFKPTGLTVGSQTLEARVVEWDYGQQQYVEGAWTAVTFELVTAASERATVESTLGLLTDSGTSATDGITGNPTLVGKISGAGALSELGISLQRGGSV